MIYQFLIVCPLVFIAGFIDAVAGGGGLITLPAYIISGLPVHTAVATNKVSSSMGSTIATVKYAINGYVNWKIAPFCVMTALSGSFIGSNLSLLLDEHIFQIVMLVLLPVIAFYVLKTKNFERNLEPYSYTKTLILCLIIAFVVGMYDGFYGPGTGAFLLLLLTGIARLSLNEAAGTTKIINLSSNYAALAVFIFNGKAYLPLGLTAGLFSMAGNYLGAAAFTKKGASFVKPMIFIVLIIFFGKLVYEIFLK